MRVRFALFPALFSNPRVLLPPAGTAGLKRLSLSAPSFTFQREYPYSCPLPPPCLRSIPLPFVSQLPALLLFWGNHVLSSFRGLAVNLSVLPPCIAEPTILAKSKFLRTPPLFLFRRPLFFLFFSRRPRFYRRRPRIFFFPRGGRDPSKARYVKLPRTCLRKVEI